jgi:hypothetical protein
MTPDAETLDAVERQREIRESAEHDAHHGPRHLFACVTCTARYPTVESLHRHWEWTGHKPLGLLGLPTDPGLRCGTCSGPSPCMLHPTSFSYRAVQ